MRTSDNSFNSKPLRGSTIARRYINFGIAMRSIDDFIKNYAPEDFDAICFAWNGKHGDELEDANYEYRNEIARKLIDGDVKGSDEILRDILLAEACFSKEAWCATGVLTDMGTLLLSQSRAKYVDSFFEAKGQSFDTECGLTCYEVPKEAIQDIVDDLKRKLKNDASRKELDFYIGYFSDYLPKGSQDRE